MWLKFETNLDLNMSSSIILTRNFAWVGYILILTYNYILCFIYIILLVIICSLGWWRGQWCQQVLESGSKIAGSDPPLPTSVISSIVFEKITELIKSANWVIELSEISYYQILNKSSCQHAYNVRIRSTEMRREKVVFNETIIG